MLCDTCVHKKVCKHIEHFEEYDKQYKEMRKKCSLFDKPIECSCYNEQKDYIDIKLKEKTDDAKMINAEINRGIIKCNLFKLNKEINETIDFLDSLSIVRFKNFSKLKENIRNDFCEIVKDIDKLKIN